METKKKIAIVGGGVTGLGAAYGLDSNIFDVTLFEQKATLGGNAHNVHVHYKNKVIPVDDAFDVFWPKRYPYFVGWLKLLNVETELMKFSQTLWDIYRNSKCIIFSKNTARFNSARMLSYLLRLRIILKKIITDEIDPNITMKTFLDSIPEATLDFRNEFFFPMIGHPYYAADMLATNLYPAQMICRSLADYILYQDTILQIKNGCQQYVTKAQQSFKHIKIKLSTAITSIVHTAHGTQPWRVMDEHGDEYRFDIIILTCPPPHMAAILKEESTELHDLLDSIPTVRAKCMVHSDPDLMPRHKKYWAFYNYLIHPRLSKPIGSLWSGQKYGKTPIFTTMEFGETILEEQHIKSLYAVNYFTMVPCTHELLEKRALLLNKHQGNKNLYFAGAWLLDTPSHEHGFKSGLHVVKDIYPESLALKKIEQEAERIKQQTQVSNLNFKKTAQEWFMEQFIDPIAPKIVRFLERFAR